MVAFISRSLLIFGALLGSSLADFCPQINVIEQLDLEKLGGTWWVWDYFGMSSYTEPHSCLVSQFYPMPGGKSINTINDYVYWTATPNHVRTTWTIDDEDPAPDGKLVATMKLNRMGVKKVPFLVMGTDYDRYLVVHMCKDGVLMSKMRSTLTLLRKTTYNEQELKDISSKVESTLGKSNMKREDLGLFHSDWYTKDCTLPKFPTAITSGKSTVYDTETLTATVNGLATHAKHAVEDANALVTKITDTKIPRRELAEILKSHADDVQALAADIKALSGL